MTFSEVSTQVGIDFVHWDPAPNNPLLNGEFVHMSGGVCAGDFDNDGYTDLYITRMESPNLLYRNLGGTFVEVGAGKGVAMNSTSTGCAWGDIDNDGDLDLYVLAGANRGHYFINHDGGASFQEDAINRGLDFDSPLITHYTSPAFGDFNLDGLLDVLVLEWSPAGRTRLLQNVGGGYFADATPAAGLNLLNIWGFSGGFADFDGDGFPEIAIAADFGTSRLLHNNSGNSFTDITASARVGTEENGMGSAIGDIDNDGDLDWFVTSIFDSAQTCDTHSCDWGYSGNRLYRNSPTRFVDITDLYGVRDGQWGWATSMFDFDNDGDLDIAMVNGIDYPNFSVDDIFNDDPAFLWRNDGDGTMTDVSQVTGFVDNRSGKGMAIFDLENDGDLDVFIVNNKEHPALFRNDGGNARNWLRVNLRGTMTNHFGIGARISLTASGQTAAQMREVHANSNYQSQNELTAHFGLGDHDGLIDKLVVFWPASQIETRLRHVAPNRFITVHEIVIGDMDGDGQVASADLGGMIECMTGPALAITNEACRPADVNADQHVDLADLASWYEMLP